MCICLPADAAGRAFRIAALLTIVLFCLPVAAFEPPIDTAGPLTVGIQRPAAGSYGAGGFIELNRTETPFPILVRLTNSGSAPLKGVLRLGVIDLWRAEPATPVAFELGPRASRTVEFQVRFGEGTFNGHYPVHAIAEFEHEGKRLTAHPILILTTNLPDPPRAALPVEWAPVRVPANGSLGLGRLPVRREQAQVSAEQPQAGASGREIFPLNPVVRYGTRVERGEARDSIAMVLGFRPPSRRERVESVRVAYPLTLPRAASVRLEFASAVSDAAARTGATIRVKAAALAGNAPAATLLERSVSSTAWKAESVDLARFAGQAIRLELEAAGETGEVYWAEPAVFGGQLRQTAAFPPAPGAASRLLGSAADNEIRLWPGTRGVLDAPIGFSGPKGKLLFRGFRARVAGDQLENWRSGSELIEAREEPAGDRYRVRHRFRNWTGAFDLMAELWVAGEGLQARFWLENIPAPRPWLSVYLEEIAAGPWSEPAHRIYGGPGNVIENPQAFRLGYDGHSLATSFIGLDFPGGLSILQGSDVTPDRVEVDPATNVATLVTPHAQRMTVLPTASVWDAVKVWRDYNGLKASGGVNKLAGRFVFDLWSGSYEPSARALERAFRYGLTDSVVIWHNWQRWGYDFRLFDIYPPNPSYGTLDEFKRLVEVTRKAGALFAPHDNYIDFYPDAEGFSYRALAFEPDGRPHKAWFHMRRDAQSYRSRPDQLRPIIERNLRLIRDGFAPNSYFIDVWSSIAPYDYWTHDGKFIDRSVTRRVWGEAFAWIREHLGDNAPQISEAGHDQLIGWLDGAQANQLRVDPKARGFAWNITAADSERIPWIDAAYHDRFILHGAGYQDRYAAGLDLKTHGMYSDDYMSTEVLCGRPAMVSMPFGRDVVRKYWLLHEAMRGLALRRIDGFEFAGGNLHRQRVRWDNGAEVLVNRGAAEWEVDGHTLAQYGFHARVPSPAGVIETAVEKRNGSVVEWTRSPALLYVNGRGTAADFGGVLTAGACRLTREGESLVLTAAPESGAFQIRVRPGRLHWKLTGFKQIETVSETGEVTASALPRRQNDEIVIDWEAGVFAYRLK